MQQATLNGIPQPTTTTRRRSRAGRPALPAEQRIQERPTVGLYKEDQSALQALRAAGYTGSDAAVMRAALRETAQAVRVAPEQRGRLAV